MVALLTTGLVALACAPAAHAKAGDLDAAFAGDGRIALPSAGAFVPRAVAIDGHHRIVVAGYACEPSAQTRDGTCLIDGDSSFRLARLTRDGGLDPKFGANGFVTTPIGAGRSQAFDLTLLSNGKIVAGGIATDGTRVVFALARYQPDGALDPGFGTGGVVLQRVGAGYAAAADVAAGPGGTVIAAGQAIDGGGARTAVARFTADGRLDPGFAAGGTRLSGPAFSYGLGLAVTSDGTITAAGLAGDSPDPSGFRFGELRLEPTGQPAGRFGTSGFAQQRVGTSASFATAVALQPAGGWLASGAATIPDGRQAMAAVRGTATGALDKHFGTGGAALVTTLDGALANDLVAYADRRALLIGQAADGGGYRFATARLRGGGRLDKSFGTGGIATVAWGRYPVARATAGALQSDGRIVTVGIGCDRGGTGTPCTGGRSVLLVARQLGGLSASDVHVSGVPERISRRGLRRGLRLRVRIASSAGLRVRLLGHRRRGGERFKLREVRRPSPGRAFALRLKPSARAVARARSGRLRLEVRATDSAGGIALRRLSIVLR